MNSEIQLYKIGETYIKFDFEYTETNRLIIKEAFLEQIDHLWRFDILNYQNYKISIEFEKGSLKTRLAIWVPIIYLGIANYGSFRAGVREIVNDVKQFSEVLIDRIDEDPNISTNEIIRTEKRTGFPGRLQEIYSRIGTYERNLNNFSILEQQSSK